MPASGERRAMQDLSPAASGWDRRDRREATVHEAKTHLSRLLNDVAAGETVVITRRGRPVATLSPITPPTEKPRRVPGRLKGLISIDDRFFEPLPEDVLRAWEGD